MGRNWKSKARKKRRHNLREADVEGWKKCSPYHFQNMIMGQRVDWWPSRSKCMIDGDIHIVKNIGEMIEIIQRKGLAMSPKTAHTIGIIAATLLVSLAISVHFVKPAMASNGEMKAFVAAQMDAYKPICEQDNWLCLLEQEGKHHAKHSK